jgi:hypothetical protein
LTDLFRPPLLAEATIVYVPAGVIGLDGGFGFEPFSNGIARPAPHPVMVTRHPSRTTLASHARRFLDSATKLNGNRLASQNRFGRFIDGHEVRAVEETPVRTVTETVVAFPSATLDGVTLQVEFAGAPVQVKLTVPVTLAAELSSNG